MRLEVISRSTMNNLGFVLTAMYSLTAMVRNLRLHVMSGDGAAQHRDGWRTDIYQCVGVMTEACSFVRLLALGLFCGFRPLKGFCL